MTDSMADWTEERGRSLTSRQEPERARSARVKGFELEVEGPELSVRLLREWRMTESGLSFDLNCTESDSGLASAAVRRRFLLSAMGTAIWAAAKREMNEKRREDTKESSSVVSLQLLGLICWVQSLNICK